MRIVKAIQSFNMTIVKTKDLQLINSIRGILLRNQKPDLKITALLMNQNLAQKNTIQMMKHSQNKSNKIQKVKWIGVNIFHAEVFGKEIIKS